MTGQDKDKFTDMDIADIIMERPYGFTVGDKHMYLYPVTLGKSYLLSRLIDALFPDKSLLASNPFVEVLRVASEKPGDLCRILAYHTYNSKRDLFDESLISARADFFIKNLSADDMATLFVITLTHNNMHDVMTRLGIDSERKRMKKALDAKKKDSNTFMFGGKSILGSLIVPACERLNMTPDQVVWGIGYNYLQLLMADSISHVYLTDEERKKARISNEETINADDPANWDKIRSYKWD